MKKLFLFFNNANQTSSVLDSINAVSGCTAECVFKTTNKCLRAIRRIHLASGLPGIGVWMLGWKRRLDSIDICICIASNYSTRILKWIKKKNKNIKCINYYWDVIAVSGYPVERHRDFENWSFDKKDCFNYGMKYSPQFYTNKVKLATRKESYEIVYVGADRQGRLKDRTSLICYCYSLFKKKGISNYIYYVSASTAIPKEIKHSTVLPEEKFFAICSRGKAILDLVENSIRWSTLRPLLALTNNKKLVTNNADIMSEPFYNDANIFILGKDDIHQLKEFLNSKFVPYPKGVLEQFSVEEWCKRFL